MRPCTQRSFVWDCTRLISKPLLESACTSCNGVATCFGMKSVEQDDLAAAVEATSGVDLLERQLQAFLDLFAIGGHGSGLRDHSADLHVARAAPLLELVRRRGRDAGPLLELIGRDDLVVPALDVAAIGRSTADSDGDRAAERSCGNRHRQSPPRRAARGGGTGGGRRRSRQGADACQRIAAPCSLACTRR